MTDAPPSLSDMEARLARHPEDWSLRIRLIEAAVRRDDMAEARRYVRESPDESPLPPDLQYRLHTMLVHGRGAFALFGEEAPVEPHVVEKPAEPQPERREEEPRAEPKSARALAAPDDELKLFLRPNPAEPEKPKATEPTPGAPRPAPVPVNLKRLREKRGRKWEHLRAKVLLETVQGQTQRQRRSQAGQKLSAFSLALLVHVATAFLVGFIVVSVPHVAPPQFIAAVEVPDPSTEPIPVPPKPNSSDPKTAAASGMLPNVIGALAESPVAIPEMDQTQSVDVTSLMNGVAPLGEGLSFSGDARETSQVNFFGMSAGGKRIVFIIDATPEMLVDEKGGMYAYDKVKNEIGIMLAGLNRGTRFNILLYQGGRLLAFADEPVVAMPSALRMAVEWLQPLNRDYERLGLGAQEGVAIELAGDIEPIPARDLAHYPKAIQKAIEWEASAIFCISAGYRTLRRSLTPEEMEAYRKDLERNPGTPGTVDPRDREAWNKAQERTREWLQKENAARAEKGLPPKVVLNFGQLVQEITGATPPQATGGTPGAQMPGREPYVPEDIEKLIRNAVKQYHRESGVEPPSVHLVAFLGEEEPMDDQTKDHFQNLTRKNNGKFKLLRGLAALQNVTGRE